MQEMVEMWLRVQILTIKTRTRTRIREPMQEAFNGEEVQTLAAAVFRTGTPVIGVRIRTKTRTRTRNKGTRQRTRSGERERPRS